MNFSAVTIFLARVVEICAQQRPPPLTMSWRHRTKLHRRSWSRVGWLRVCIVKWCRERRKEVESRPRIATQPNESTSNGAKMRISFVVFQGKASPFFLIEFILVAQKSRVSVRGWRSGSFTNTCVTRAERWSVRLGYGRWWSAGRNAYDEKEKYRFCITVIVLPLLYHRFSWVYALH